MSAACPQTVTDSNPDAAPKSTVKSLRRLLGSVFAAQLGLRLFAMPAALATTLLLSHTLEPAQFGSYSYVLAWVSLLVVPATMGFDGFLVREISASCALRDWGLLRGLLGGPARVVWLASLALGAVAVGAVLWLLLIKQDSDLAVQVMIGIALVPVVALRQIYRSSMQGLQRPLLGFVPEFFVQPLAMLLLAAIAVVVMHGRLSAWQAVICQVGAGVLALVVGRLLLKKSLPREIDSAVQRTEYRRWIRGAMPFLLAQLIFLANEKLSMLTLGMTADFRDVGVFALASSLAMLVVLPLLTMNSVISGRIAQLYTIGDRVELQRQLLAAVKVCVLAALPIALVEILFGDRLLGLFREDFSAGYMVLRILAVGQFFNIASGPVGAVLTMSGHTRDTVTAAVLSTGLGLACCVLLIPPYGAVGAALAQSAGVIAFNALLVAKIHQHLGIDPTILAALRRTAT